MFIINIFNRLFTLIFYLCMLPIHFIGLLVSGVLLICFSILDIPLWVITGKSFLTSTPFHVWFEWHGNNIF